VPAGESVKQQFGRRVRQLREIKGRSQERLAAEAQLHATYLSGVERGKRKISIENIAKLAKALEVPIAALFNDAS
jgi:transcriptional regulator with XRE-family HTH domain